MKTKTITLFKSVNKDLSSKYDSKFKYKVGEWFEEKECDESNEECSEGLHASSLIFANGYNRNKDQVLLKIKVNEKDIIVKGEDKVRCKRLFVEKILTNEEIDKQLEKEFYEKFKVKGLWNYCKEFRTKKFLTKKITNKEKEKIKKLLINTNKKLKKYRWDYKDNVRFVSLSGYYSLWDSLVGSLGDSLWYSLVGSLRDSLVGSLRDSLVGSLRDSLRDSLVGSLRDSLRDSLWYSLRDSLWYSLRDSLACKISKKHNDDLLDDLIEVFRMGYLVAGKDKNNNWMVIVK